MIHQGWITVDRNLTSSLKGKFQTIYRKPGINCKKIGIKDTTVIQQLKETGQKSLADNFLVFSYSCSYYIYLWKIIPGKICKRLLHWPGSDIVQNLRLFLWRKLSLGLFIVKHSTLGRSHADRCCSFGGGFESEASAPVLQIMTLAFA